RSLASYIAQRIRGQPVDEDVFGRQEGAILQIKPVPQYACNVSIDGAAPADRVSFELTDPRQRIIATGEFKGDRHALHHTPDFYDLRLTIPAAVVTNIDPLPFELYEDCNVRFRKSDVGIGPAPSPPPVPVSPVAIAIPGGAEATLQSFTTGETITFHESGTQSLLAGDYLAKVTDRDGTPIDTRNVQVQRGGRETSIDLTEFKSSPLRAALLSQIPGDHRAGAVDFSETLGPLSDQDLSLWLAIIGASRIVPGASSFSKLGRLPLASFSNMSSGDTGLFILSGFANPDTSFELGFQAGEETVWFQPEAIPEFPGLYQFEHIKAWNPPTAPGWHSSGPITFRVNNRATVTILSSMLPNRITLITLSIDEDDQQQIGQYLLPVEHLVGVLPEEIRDKIEGRGYLRSTKFIAQAQRLFGKRRDIFVGGRREALTDLLYLKWVDPIMAIMAAYELIRSGEREGLGEVAANLERFFPELPDTWAIRRLVKADAPFRGWPIFSDGLLAFAEQFDRLPFPAERLDYLSAWTQWRGAIQKAATRRIAV
ncbi:MAG TPA: hypothetical protein VGK48_26170, partial [Terriglobia bacterium]